MDVQAEEASFLPVTGDTFKFSCHKGIACFTHCCAKLSLVLTPYDILRIKKRLGVSSEDFLEKFTDTKVDSNSRFPRVTLKMNGDKNGTCPFVTPEGCSIYEDRPGACRFYPLGRAAMKLDRDVRAKEKFFLVRETHCRGFEENREWTVQEWISNEGLEEYNVLNDLWLEIVTSQKSLGPEAQISRKLQMFFMASYNLDKFREFLFKSPFFERFEVDADQKEALAADDVALMKFAFQWLKFSLFGQETMQIKKPGP